MRHQGFEKRLGVGRGHDTSQPHPPPCFCGISDDLRACRLGSNFRDCHKRKSLCPCHATIGALFPRGATQLEVFALQRESLVAVASGFPEAQKHLRKCAIKLALRREILKAALAVKRLKSPMAANAVKNWRRKSMTIVSQRESNRSLAPTSAVPSFEEYYRKQQENDRTPKPLAHAELLAEFRSLLQETEARLDAKVVALGEKLETVLAAKMRGSFSEV